MKKNISNIIGLVMTVLLFSCNKELQKFDDKAIIYFNETGRSPAYSGEVLRDSTILSFSLSKVSDSIVTMVVNTIGAPQNLDRPYTMLVNPLSNAVPGKHYEIINQDFVIKKNQQADTIKIKFHRLEEMQNESFLLSFDLQDNENFATSMKDKILDKITGKKISYINYRWYVNDIIKRPARWWDGALGVFTRKKLFLIAEVLGVDPAYLDTTASLAETTAYGKFMQRYLNEQQSEGNIIYEENGTIMIMGPSVQ